MKNNMSYKSAIRAAFPYTVPVLVGYLFIGIAFGVMYQEKGYSFIWAVLMSLLVYAGSGQYLAVNFFAPGVSLFQVVFLEFMVNIRHIFYGLSLLERFHNMGKKKLYMIFSLTDETYSLFFATKVPQGVDERKFLLSIAVLDQIYWVTGSAIGGIAGSILPFNSEGIEFAMTALFLVILTEQWMEVKNRFPAVAGIVFSVICLMLFGPDNFILPTMVCVMVLMLSCKKFIEKEDEKSMEKNGEPKKEVTKVAN